ncbi:MAG: hypothetical protein JG774_1776 [Desulfomicrobiaceae bacterium]|jgi:uncharacterized membrane protein|nr:hypothetical protein [Desulfomicrobiaceae bacterium]MBZ4686031.1 hypothetical protein [Desulfomicrobiaceae bacterium]MDI3492457.1 hypothetical protein [Desulfomicrobiaceae bacterium]MDK2873484.1 hypothetical protein [Desulfomicrobiaceae bacterium]HCF04683.1 DUF502 domain-containing protein [Desulfomicrobiaceae bacterium]
MAQLRQFLKTNILAGFFTLLPAVITIWFIRLVLQWIDKIFLLLPRAWRPEHWLPFPVPGLGLLVLIPALILTGFLVRHYVGRQIVRLWDEFITRVPLANKVYFAVKQLVDTLMHGPAKDFQRVVLIEYPRRGIYAVAFVTGVASGEVQDKTQERVLNVFLPTTPNPTSGFLLLIPETDVIALSMSVEDAFKLIMSGGIVTPPHRNSPHTPPSP